MTAHAKLRQLKRAASRTNRPETKAVQKAARPNKYGSTCEAMARATPDPSAHTKYSKRLEKIVLAFTEVELHGA